MTEPNQHEDGDRDDQEGQQQGGGVQEGTAVQAGDQANRDADEDLQRPRDHGELDGDREGLLHHVEHGAAGEGLAEVQGHDALEVVAVLHEQRLVEVVFLVELLDERRVTGTVTTQRGSGIARKSVDHGVQQQCRQDEHGDHLEQSPEHISTHNFSSSFLVHGAGIGPRGGAGPMCNDGTLHAR